MQLFNKDGFLRNRPTIGVLAGWQFYHTATNLSYLEPIYRGMSHAAYDVGCNLMLACGIGIAGSSNDPLRPAWPVKSVDSDYVPIGPWNTDGLIFANPVHSNDRSEYVQRLLQKGFPVLFVGAGEEGPAIIADNEGGIEEAMEHLLGHGHRNIVFIAGSREDMQGDTGVRLNAFYASLEKHNLPLDSRMIVYGRHVFDGGYLAMQEILSHEHPFSAVLASNDESAMGAMQALQEAGKRIPEDVAVIGFDDRPEGLVQVPPLTTIHVPLFDIGYRAVIRMMDQLNGKEVSEQVLRIPTKLLVRNSCGCENLLEDFDIEQQDDVSKLVMFISSSIYTQVHSMTEGECLVIAEQLVTAFSQALKNNDAGVFLKALHDVLAASADQGSAALVWHQVVTYLQRAADLFAEGEYEQENLSTIVDRSRQYISTELNRLHRKYSLEERLTATRLGRLNTQLQISLSEPAVYNALSQYLPDLDINVAYLCLNTAANGASSPEYRIKDSIDLSRSEVIAKARDFPPEGMFDEAQPFMLTLIPLMDRLNQIGFAVFDTGRLEFYGSIAQQVVGALKTVDLYRHATEGKRMAEEANVMKGRFLSTISHELRTPLNLIVGLSGIMIREMDDGQAEFPEHVQRDAERIHAYAQHLGGLIGDVLDLASSDAGRLKLNFEPMDLSDALKMVASSGRQLALDKGLNWHADIPSSGPWVHGDRTRLRQIALNLINNAIKFTDSGSIKMWLEEEAGRVTVFVQDTGMGIPPDEQAVIFEEFYRTNRTISKGFSGLGLGLAISKRLLDMHGGTIGVRSSSDEKTGATFLFTLPVIAPPIDTAEDTAMIAGEQPMFLLLTEDWQAGERFRQQMGLHNANVRLAILSEESVWRSLDEGPMPDAIVLDISTMPELGWHVFNRIKQNPGTKAIPVIFYSSSEEGEALLNLDYMTKPLDHNDLTRSIDAHLLLGETESDEKKILLVDDDASTREMHARIVQSHDGRNKVLNAGNGREALDIMQREHVNLVLLDLQMPEIDGFAVLEAMQYNEKLRDIPVIVITGTSLTEEEMARLNQGVSVVLRKGLFKIDETISHIRNSLTKKKKLSRDAQRLVRTAMAFLHENYHKPINRADIAQHIGISEDYLTYSFRQELGTTPIQYLRRLRINKARNLLKTTRKSVTEIALEVGFTDSGYFSRVFRRETGKTPEVFRSK